MSLLNRASAATGILKELTASGMDEGVGTDHPSMRPSPVSGATALTPIV
jgi:hypothetical protein